MIQEMIIQQLIVLSKTLGKEGDTLADNNISVVHLLNFTVKGAKIIRHGAGLYGKPFVSKM